MLIKSLLSSEIVDPNNKALICRKYVGKCVQCLWALVCESFCDVSNFILYHNILKNYKVILCGPKYRASNTVIYRDQP
jgi:hypothetical protein